MSLLESVRHFTFLLSHDNLRFTRQKQPKDHEQLKQEVEGFSQKIEDAIANYNPSPRNNGVLSASAITADVAVKMFNASGSLKGDNDRNDTKHIDVLDREHVTDTAVHCLGWAHDPARPAIPGAAAMTKDQV